MRRFRVKKVLAVLVLGSRSFQLAPGETERVRIRLPRRTTRLARRGRIHTRVTALSRDAAGNVAESTRRVRIKVRR